MEAIASILAALLGIVSTPGIVIDQVATDLLRQRLVKAETLEVRIDNTPNYQILFGRVDKIRLAARGVFLVPYFRIAVVELETDPISIDANALQQGQLVLNRPLQAATRVQVTAEDINQALRSPELRSNFENIPIDLSGRQGEGELFDFTEPTVRFRAGNRIQIMARMRPQGKPQGTIDLEINAGVRVLRGSQLELIEPQINLQGEKVPDQITTALVKGINRLLDLQQLEPTGIRARVLRLEVTDTHLQVIGFAQVTQVPR